MDFKYIKILNEKTTVEKWKKYFDKVQLKIILQDVEDDATLHSAFDELGDYIKKGKQFASLALHA